MRAHLFAIAAALVVLVSGFITPAYANENQVVAFGEYRLSGPYTHEKLSILLIHGPERLPGKQYITLQEAMEQGKVIVHDNKGVAVENLSDEDLFVQSTDIIEGGCQDRCFPEDFIVQGGSGLVPVTVFCVEAGRSNPRGTENPRQFHSSDHIGAGKNFKLAARLRASQDGVWSEVASNQQKLTRSLGSKVEAEISPSSFPLTLENEKLMKAIEPYVTKLSPTIDDKDDVVGYAFAINGKVNSADIYGNRGLFLKMWPKLLRGSAVEAVAEHPNADGDQQPIAPPPTKQMVVAALEKATEGTAKGKMAGGRTVHVTRETAAAAMFETIDPKAAPDAFVHRSYIAIDPPPAVGEENGTWRRRTK